MKKKKKENYESKKFLYQATTKFTGVEDRISFLIRQSRENTKNAIRVHCAFLKVVGSQGVCGSQLTGLGVAA